METLNERINAHSVTVGDIASLYPGATNIFNKYNIDYCCGGQTSLSNACAKANVKPEMVINEILHAPPIHSGRSIHFEKWDPVLLVQYILQNHHTYVKESIPEIQELLNKACQVHATQFPSLNLVKETFEKLSQELLTHLHKEEAVIFPLVIKIFSPSQERASTFEPAMSLEQPMKMMEDDHQHAGDLIKTIRLLTESYTTPPSACPTFQLAYTKLQEFDQDLMQHIHLENNVLFAKVKNALHSNATF